MEKCNFLVDKECVWHPDEVDVLGANHKLGDPKVIWVKGQTGVRPELPEIHVKCKVHILK